MADQFDIVILGGGPAGYVGAIRASQLGKRVAVVERDKLGGVCTHSGCIPTKAMLQSAEVAETARRAREFGVAVEGVGIDFAGVHAHKDRVVAANHKGIEYLMRKHGVAVFSGAGRLLAPTTVAVSLSDGSETELRATDVIVATGSRPRAIPGLEFDGRRILDSTGILALREVPRTLAILGAGAVGMEFATAFHGFGTQVTLVELMPRVLPGEDEEISDAVHKAFTRRGIAIHTNATVTAAERVEGGLALTVKNGEATQTIETEYLLVAVSRQPNVEDIGLEAVGAELERGAIRVDGAMRTTAPHVYAAGDVVGNPMLAHVASDECIRAVEVIAGAEGRPVNYQRVPRPTFCHPQVASFGLTETQARDAGHAVRVGRFPFSANGKARILLERDGLVKMVNDERTGEILGIHMVGPEVTEVLHEGLIAAVLESTALEVGSAVHAHPTLSEAVKEAALDALGRVLHV